MLMTVDEDYVTSPESSMLVERDGELIVVMRGKLFPKAGGAECGQTFGEFNLTQHLRQLIAEALAGTR